MIEHVLFWETQADVDDNLPAIVEADRVVKSGGLWYAHGSCHLFRGSRYAREFGNPLGVGSDDTGIELVDAPAVGKCTLPVPSHGAIANHAANNNSLTSGSWKTLTGGALGSGAVDIAWDDSTGTITISRSGNWEICFSISAEWAVGILSPRIEVAIWDTTGTPAITDLQGSMRFSGLGDGRSCSAGLPLTVADGTQLQLQVQANQTGTLDVRHFSIGLKRRP